MTPLAIALIVLVRHVPAGAADLHVPDHLFRGGDPRGRGHPALSVIHNSLFDGLNLFPLLAIPCFVVAGTLMEFGNITQQIVDVVKQLVGRVYGGLGITTILACTFFAAISGSGAGDRRRRGHHPRPGNGPQRLFQGLRFGGGFFRRHHRHPDPAVQPG